ncbi:tyrosine-type recombinase/integrase [Gemmata sp.]|uniref:tyrosine-type recombinase/integrase n=1 Tax=Gemmata sp. TaxID=1914242 RepID=UPI003F70A7D1
MARSASPWYWERRRCWAVVIDGQRHVLGEHPDDTPPKKRKGKWVVPASIQDAFYKLMAAPAAPPPKPSILTVGSVLERFLAWCQLNRTERTYEWSRNHIQHFCDHLKSQALSPKTMPASDLAPIHVTEWVDANRRKRPGKRLWGPNHCRGAIIAVQRAFRWAEQQGLLDRSPIRHVEKPAAKRREQVLNRAEFDTLLGHVKDAAFREVLEFSWETGCRVQELRLLDASHYKPDRGRFELPPRQAKGKKRWRLIYLTARAEEIVKPLVERVPDGPIFRNADGNPWDAQNFNCRFFRLEKKLGVKYALTSIRHSYATRLLEAGCDHVTVSALLGHVDAVMLSRVYSHVGDRADFLREELLRASGDRKPAA